MHATFPKLSKSWELFEFTSFLKIRRNLMTSDKIYSATQEIITHENKHKKKYQWHLSTPHQIILHKKPDSEIQHVKEVVCKNASMNSIIFKSQILDTIISIEKNIMR